MTFSLQLSDDVIEVRDWVHQFAAEVVRPAAAEWDEREETPWPVIQEAAKVGLYSPELFAQQAAEPTGLGMLTVFEELQDSSQLIVITHQKRTMEIADALYGVTMHGDGVSKVISQRIP